MLCRWYESLKNTADPLNWTPDGVALHLKNQGIPDTVFTKFCVASVTGRGFIELDHHAVQNILGVGDSDYCEEILIIVDNLKEIARSRGVSEVPELRNHDWMLRKFEVTLNSLNKRSDDVQRVVHRNLWGAVKAARSREAREEKKRSWLGEYEKNRASKNAGEEVGIDAEAPPKKKPRTLARHSTSGARPRGLDSQAGPSSISRQSMDAAGGHRGERPRKCSRSGGRQQQFHPSSNKSANGLRRSTRLRGKSQNGSLSRRGSRG